MVSFSAWQEAPDFLQFHTLFEGDALDPKDGLPVFDYAGTGIQEQTPFQEPPNLVTEDELRLATIAASPDSLEGGGGDWSAVQWGVTYGWSYNVSSSEGTSSSWGAASVRRSFRIAPGDTYTFNPANEGYSFPAGTIGIDYENLPYDPDAFAWRSGPATIVSRALSAATTRFGGDWRMDQGDEVPGSPTNLMLRPFNTPGAIFLGTLPPPATANAPGEVQRRTLNTSIDITDYVSDVGWAGTVLTRQEQTFVPPVGDPGTVTPLDNGNSVYYGWGLERLRIDTMVRPPRWRWVYAAEAPESYRRIFPRDDIGRTFPPSRAFGSGNRTAGGYL